MSTLQDWLDDHQEVTDESIRYPGFQIGDIVLVSSTLSGFTCAGLAKAFAGSKCRVTALWPDSNEPTRVCVQLLCRGKGSTESWIDISECTHLPAETIAARHKLAIRVSSDE